MVGIMLPKIVRFSQFGVGSAEIILSRVGGAGWLVGCLRKQNCLGDSLVATVSHPAVNVCLGWCWG